MWKPWADSSNERAVANARVAATELSRLRVERAEAELYVAEPDVWCGRRLTRPARRARPHPGACGPHRPGTSRALARGRLTCAP